MFEKGFLPAKNPLFKLSRKYRIIEDLGTHLPKLLVNKIVRKEVKKTQFPDLRDENNPRVLERIFLTLCFLTHGYVFESDPVQSIPNNLAYPLTLVAEKLKRPPVLSYATYALNNWRLLDPKEEISLNNLSLIQNFLGGKDEDWFVMIHIVIEFEARHAIKAINEYTKDISKKTAEFALRNCLKSLNQMNSTLARMPENCDPYIYYNRVRPYIFGWKNNPAMPNGLIYEGIWSEPKFFRGETGAQSTIIPTLDAFLGVNHRDDPLKAYLFEMRDYMPPQHRQFIQRVETALSVRHVILSGFSELKDLYNQTIEQLEKFRSTHLQFALDYIYKQNQKMESNPNSVGTGGTPFVEYLRKHRDETSEALLS